MSNLNKVPFEVFFHLVVSNNKHFHSCYSGVFKKRILLVTKIFQLSLKKYTKATKKSNFSSQFLRMQKNQLIDLKLNLERYVITLLEFEFNSGRYELKLIKSYVIPWVQQHHQTSFLKPRKQVRPKTFFLMGGLTVPTRSRMKCYLHTKPFSVN